MQGSVLQARGTKPEAVSCRPKLNLPAHRKLLSVRARYFRKLNVWWELWARQTAKCVANMNTLGHRGATALACIVLLLSTTTLAATPESAPESTTEVGDATRDLVSGNVPAALEVLAEDDASGPAPATSEMSCKFDGTNARMPVATHMRSRLNSFESAAIVAGPKADTPALNEDFIESAANDLHYYTQNLQGNNFDLTAYKRSFSEALARLKPADQPQLSQAVGADLASVMRSSLENAGFFQSAELAPLIVVAHLAGLDQAFVDGFKQVCFLWHL